MGNGFIRDELEIKFLILYIAARVAQPLPLAGMQDLTMCDDGIDYFAFSVCLNDLVKTEHLRMTEDDCYAITAKGLRNSAICETSLPYSVRMRADKKIAACNKELLRQAQVRARISRRENGTYTVELSLNDDLDNLMHLELMVATEAMANDLANRFRKNPEQVYTDMLSVLYAPTNN
ncbi:MAG: DUF4364 family protein [Clostridiales bacterium]|nr:DUF4364 family protein [Candidatus Cacconaster stercorequi]